MNRFACTMCGYVYSNRLSAEQCEDADRAEEQAERRRTNKAARHAVE